MSSPASLRDLYAPPSNAWSFNTVAQNGSTAAEISSPPSSSSYQWSTRTQPNPLFDLSANLSRGEEESGLDVGGGAERPCCLCTATIRNNGCGYPMGSRKDVVASPVDPKKRGRDNARGWFAAKGCRARGGGCCESHCRTNTLSCLVFSSFACASADE